MNFFQGKLERKIIFPHNHPVGKLIFEKSISKGPQVSKRQSFPLIGTLSNEDENVDDDLWDRLRSGTEWPSSAGKREMVPLLS